MLGVKIPAKLKRHQNIDVKENGNMVIFIPLLRFWDTFGRRDICQIFYTSVFPANMKIYPNYA